MDVASLLNPPFVPSYNSARRVSRYLSEPQVTTIRNLFFTGQLTKSQIQERTQCSQKQVKRAISGIPYRQRPGRPPILAGEDLAEMITLVRSSRRWRLLTFADLAREFQDGRYTPWCVEHALRRCGFRRRTPRRKPFLNEHSRFCRLLFAREHINWTVESRAY